MITLLGVTNFLARFVCSARSTCVKHIGYDSASIESTTIRSFYTNTAYIESANIRNTCTKDTCVSKVTGVRDISSAKGTCVKDVFVGSTSVKTTCAGSANAIKYLVRHL